MKAEAEANAEMDRKAKERIDKINQADSMIFQTEKQLKEFGDKIPEAKRKPIDSALDQLKEAHKNQDVQSIDKAIADLNAAFQAASEDMYKAQNQPQGDPTQQQSGSSQNTGNSKPEQEVTDVDFEEVK